MKSGFKQLFLAKESHMRIGLLFSAIGSGAFALYNGFLGVKFSSVFYGSICAYALLLLCVRGGIFFFEEKKGKTLPEEEKFRCRKRIFIFSSVFLFLMNIALVVPVGVMVVFQKEVRVGMIGSIFMATYTTYKMTRASLNYKRSRNHANLSLRALGTINFADAFVSLLTLQNTLIMVNGGSEDGDMLILSAVVGGVVMLLILLLNAVSLVKGVRTKFSAEEKTPSCRTDG